MDKLIKEIRNCRICESNLPLGPRPIFAAHPQSKIVIIGQAPGLVVHKTGIPWDDKSGDNLRNWMGITNESFYNVENIALIPMGFCYPGKGKSGDNPPRKECAPQWHNILLSQIEKPELIILIGKYAQEYYLESKSKKTLTETVKNYNEYLTEYFVLPHPSPRNNIWMKKNEWFLNKVVPKLKLRIERILKL
ncbi:uracil-DNA glycosylase family protein [Ancylomarina sp. YFZ004]